MSCRVYERSRSQGSVAAVRPWTESSSGKWWSSSRWSSPVRSATSRFCLWCTLSLWSRVRSCRSTSPTWMGPSWRRSSSASRCASSKWFWSGSLSLFRPRSSTRPFGTWRKPWPCRFARRWSRTLTRSTSRSRLFTESATWMHDWQTPISVWRMIWSHSPTVFLMFTATSASPFSTSSWCRTHCTG